MVWGAGVQSNNCRQTAAACAKAGLDIHLVLGRGKPADGPDPVQGNLLLDHLVGAHIEIIDGQVGPEVDARIAEVAAELPRGRSQRLRVGQVHGQVAWRRSATCCAWSRSSSRPRGRSNWRAHSERLVSPGCLRLFGRIHRCRTWSLAAAATGGPDYPRPPRGSRSSGRGTPGPTWPRSRPRRPNGLASRRRFEGEDIELFEEFVGPAYGEVTPGCLEAMAVLARTEGILVDPSYSGKALAGLIDHIRSGQLDPEQPVVFVHTGWHPGVVCLQRGAVRADRGPVAVFAGRTGRRRVTGGC